jgi:methyl-accepting chemotaxis protein PixJ
MQYSEPNQFNNNQSELAANSSSPTSKWSKLSLKTKVTLLAISLGLVPLSIVGVLSYSQIHNALKEQTIKTQKYRAEAIADKLNRFVFERNGDVEILAGQPIFADPKLAATVSKESKAKLLDQYVSSYLVYDSIAAFDLQGNLIAQSKGDSLSNQLDRKYFQGVIKTSKTFISEPEKSATTGKLVVYFASPIKDLETGCTN